MTARPLCSICGVTWVTSLSDICEGCRGVADLADQIEFSPADQVMAAVEDAWRASADDRGNFSAKRFFQVLRENGYDVRRLP